MKRFFLFLFLISNYCFAAGLGDAYKAYQKKDYKTAEEILKNLQVKDPFNPQINYNLGNVLYRQDHFESAAGNFERAFENTSIKKQMFKEEAGFNWGNSFLQQTLKNLGSDWENKKIDEKVIDQAAQQATSAMGKYKKVLEINRWNEKTKNNLVYAEELLEKIKQKKQQQQQNKDDQQNEQDKDQQDKNKDQKKDQQNNDKGKNQDRDKNQDSSSDQKQNNDQKDQQNNQDQKNKEEQKQENSEDEQQQSQQEQQAKKEEKENQQVASVAEEKDEKADVELKGIRAVLDQLQEEDGKKQKRMIKLLAQGDAPSSLSRKNW